MIYLYNYNNLNYPIFYKSQPKKPNIKLCNFFELQKYKDSILSKNFEFNSIINSTDLNSSILTFAKKFGINRFFEDSYSGYISAKNSLKFYLENNLKAIEFINDLNSISLFSNQDYQDKDINNTLNYIKGLNRERPGELKYIKYPDIIIQSNNLNSYIPDEQDNDVCLYFKFNIYGLMEENSEDKIKTYLKYLSEYEDD